jgi:excisionase family DNA binding protein
MSHARRRAPPADAAVRDTRIVSETIAVEQSSGGANQCDAETGAGARLPDPTARARNDRHVRADRIARMEMKQPNLLKVAQVAEILATADRTVSRAIEDGHLRAIKIGRLVRIDPRDLEAFIRNRRK